MSRALRSAVTLSLLAPLCALAAPVARDAELEQRGARIGNVEVQVDDVFETSTHLAAPYRIANDLHISTHEATVQSQLLFHTGDKYDRHVLNETARILRALRYLNEASVEPVRYNEAENTVDVLVRVHDVWTLSPGVSFGRKGGENSSKVTFEDTNFLGFGKHLTFARSANVDRSAWEFGYVDPNLFGSWWRMSADYAALSDGDSKVLSLERPFYALDTRWSAGLSAMDQTSDVSRYSLGHVTQRLQMLERKFEIGGGFSEGLHDGWTSRYLAGVRYDARDFQTLPDQPDAAIPADRVVAYPWVGWEVLEDQYISTRNLDQIGRTEDVYLGLSAHLEAGFAAAALGSTHDGLILNGKLQAGADLGHEQYLIHSLGFGTRVEGDALANASLEWATRYYLRESVHRVLFASVSGTVTSHRDPEEQLLLGGDNGLRGYPLRYQAGDSLALVTLEQRFYTDWQPLKLFNVGAAVFFDAGRAWGQDPYATAPAGWLKDVGIGLRLGSARSGLGNVLHIDLAFPLDRSSDIDSMQLLIETRKSF
jgi:outer membrane protein assembly factor BamA